MWRQKQRHTKRQTSNVPDTKPERDAEGLQDHKPRALFPRWDASRESPPVFHMDLQTILTPREIDFNRPRQLGTVGLWDLPWTAQGGFSAWQVQPYLCPECTMPLLCPCNHICLFSFIEDTDVHHHFNRIQEKTAVHLYKHLPTTGFQHLKQTN